MCFFWQWNRRVSAIMMNVRRFVKSWETSHLAHYGRLYKIIRKKNTVTALGRACELALGLSEDDGKKTDLYVCRWNYPDFCIDDEEHGPRVTCKINPDPDAVFKYSLNRWAWEVRTDSEDDSYVSAPTVTPSLFQTKMIQHKRTMLHESRISDVDRRYLNLQTAKDSASPLVINHYEARLKNSLCINFPALNCRQKLTLQARLDIAHLNGMLQSEATFRLALWIFFAIFFNWGKWFHGRSQFLLTLIDISVSDHMFSFFLRGRSVDISIMQVRFLHASNSLSHCCSSARSLDLVHTHSYPPRTVICAGHAEIGVDKCHQVNDDEFELGYRFNVESSWCGVRQFLDSFAIELWSIHPSWINVILYALKSRDLAAGAKGHTAEFRFPGWRI